MSKQSVLLVCGSGASSGFMAAATRKAAKKSGLDLDIKARSESEAEDFMDKIDLLLFAPHLKYMLDDFKEMTDKNNVKSAVIPQMIYGSLDGKRLVKFIEKELGE
ncbi:hypothetical protein C5L30_001024 [Companilactobacillus farciminis]|uniref:PTS EIIB type-3 domain-containing protein n=1 Tax=Companilactobacillus farciminis TaxID=1612 RepID=A0A4R5NER6_9LACO|nr:PTS lactose transporter subunit IIB [Companilactobacillus farciminis]ATO46586.1 PTS sugar transporter subunit IIB [Companilactobacillus farciminis KCTC 3681 = DSM 20184]KRK63371.1 phosphotransferase system lactose cellobiose-specific IIB subunit [Companilactobacillus farciminis KCTC 3681 = DSM 20184]TDG72213.1 hypothetical protein C5L30_001024 [Companilactobacillus farciminis]